MLSSLALSTKCGGRAEERKMAATSLSSSPPRATAKLAGVPRSSSFYTQLSFCSRHPFQKAAAATAFQKLPSELLLLSSPARNWNRHARTSCRATDNDQAAPAAAQETTTPSTPTEKQAPVTPGNDQPGGGGGGRRGSRLPEAPGNLFDDSKRGMPKEGWTFELPFGVDVFLVLVSFTLITTVMFGTAFLVWKLGAIHFNEY
ncbi:unnamed protein product [Urochloa humidicola]